MGLISQLRKEKLESYKNKDMVKNGVITLLLSALSLKEKEEKRELSDEETIQIIQRELKQTKETLHLTPADREDLIKETNYKIEILMSYLPQQLSFEAVREAVEAYLAKENIELSNKTRGQVMKAMLSQLSGQTDGQTLNKVLTELLKG